MGGLSRKKNSTQFTQHFKQIIGALEFSERIMSGQVERVDSNGCSKILIKMQSSHYCCEGHIHDFLDTY